MLLSQRPTSLLDLRQQPLPPPGPPGQSGLAGVELLSTITLAPQGIVGTTWNPSLIEIDAPTSFGKYHTFSFHISGLGFSASASLLMDIRRNYTNGQVNRSLQYWSVTGTATNQWVNPGSVAGAQPIATSFTANQYARDIEIQFTQTGVNTVVRAGSDTTLIIGAIQHSTQSWVTSSGTFSEVYGFNTIPGIRLAPGSGTFYAPYYPPSISISHMRVECKIYGWRR